MKKSIKMVALVLAAMMAFTGCAVEDEGVSEEDTVEEPQDTLGEFGDDTSDDLEAAASSLQADCGRITCTVRLNRAWTKRVAQGASTAASVASVACRRAPSPLGIAACTAAVKGLGLLLKSTASKYYNRGNCVGLRYGLLPTKLPEVTRGTYNCS
ncbi:MAG: hypothetical protein R3B48_01980 [Kofleriaceae bacterium]